MRMCLAGEEREWRPAALARTPAVLRTGAEAMRERERIR